MKTYLFSKVAPTDTSLFREVSLSIQAPSEAAAMLIAVQSWTVDGVIDE